jgi:hypothetical protein
MILPAERGAKMRRREFLGALGSAIYQLQQPALSASKLGFATNLKTARALDLDIPPTVLASADEVIE